MFAFELPGLGIVTTGLPTGAPMPLPGEPMPTGAIPDVSTVLKSTEPSETLGSMPP